MRMTPGLLAAFGGFVLVNSITPGPNNTMLLASGATFGFRRTLPHMAGIAGGVALMLLAVGLGAGQVVANAPWLRTGMAYAGTAYLLWLAWKIATAHPALDGPAGGHPLTLVQAALFQWVNPKAWLMILGAVGVYAPMEGYAGNIVLLAGLMAVVNLPCVALWAGFGDALRPLLARPGRLRAFNVGMAALLVLSLLPALLR